MKTGVYQDNTHQIKSYHIITYHYISYVIYHIVSYRIVSHHIILYYILSHALKNTANQRPGLPLHILRYATGNMQRVVFHSTFNSRHCLCGTVYRGPFEDFSKANSETLQLLRTITNISDVFVYNNCNYLLILFWKNK